MAHGIVFASIASVTTDTTCPGFCTPDTPLAERMFSLRKRNNRVVVCFDDHEFQELTRMVNATSLPRESFIRNAIFGVKIKEAPPADVPYLLREFKRIGNNINQILLIANTRGILDIPRLRSALDELKEADRLVFRTYAGKD